MRTIADSRVAPCEPFDNSKKKKEHAKAPVCYGVAYQCISVPR